MVRRGGLLVSTDVAPLLAREEDHPQELLATHGSVRVIGIDSARYCDARNIGDVMVAASYCGVLPVRLMAPHQPRAVIGHDVNIAKDGSGIQGLFYLEALGIPAATVDGSTAELGNALDMFTNGKISRMNILAERCGVTYGMAAQQAAELLATQDPGDVTPTTKVRREIKESSAANRSIVVTDSIVFAQPEDNRNVLVTAGHTGPTGARFITEVSPHGFICADGGRSKNDSGISGLVMLQEAGLAGACYDVSTAAMGDAFDAWEVGRIAACNELARQRGVYVGQRVDEAARCLLAETTGAPSSPQARHEETGSVLLRSGQLAGLTPKFAEGLARVREVCDLDGALPAGIKALFMATAAVVRNHEETARRELRRAVERGVTVKQAPRCLCSSRAVSRCFRNSGQPPSRRQAECPCSPHRHRARLLTHRQTRQRSTSSPTSVLFPVISSGWPTRHRAHSRAISSCGSGRCRKICLSRSM